MNNNGTRNSLLDSPVDLRALAADLARNADESRHLQRIERQLDDIIAGGVMPSRLSPTGPMESPPDTPRPREDVRGRLREIVD